MLAFYGHPDAGTCWEKHCDGKLREAGFLPIVNWAGCYRHSTLRAVLSVYVDDFKLACHTDDEKKIWKLLQSKIKLEDPAMLKQYLGCTHIHQEGDLDKEVKVPGGWLPIPGYKEAIKAKAEHKTKGIEYNMSSFIEQCVSAYLELAGLPVTAVGQSRNSVHRRDERLHDGRTGGQTCKHRAQGADEDPLRGEVLPPGLFTSHMCVSKKGIEVVNRV